MPKRTKHLHHPDHRRRSHRDRPGLQFDYSGTQAVKTLKGYRIVLVNSNPATIMTDPELADATISSRSRRDRRQDHRERAPRHPRRLRVAADHGRADRAELRALSLRRQGTLDKFDVEMIGATADAIDKAEDRQLFRNAMEKIGLQTPKSRLANASAAEESYRDKYLAERKACIGAALEGSNGRGRSASERRKRYQEHALGEALMALSEIGLPAIAAHPSPWAAPAAASPTTRKSFSTSSSAASTRLRPTRS